MDKYFLFLLLSCPLFPLAQKLKPPVDYQTSIHFNPFALAELDYTFLTGMEFRARPRVSVVTETGYVFASDYTQHNAESNPASGWIIRPSVRLFMNERKNFYLQPQIFYKMVTHHLHDWLGMDGVNGVPAYEELRNFRYRRKIFGFNATCGFLVPLSRSGNSFLDFYFGLGARHKKSIIPGIPNAAYNRGNFFVRLSDDEGTVPSVPAGIKLVFVVE